MMPAPPRPKPSSFVARNGIGEHAQGREGDRGRGRGRDQHPQHRGHRSGGRGSFHGRDGGHQDRRQRSSPYSPTTTATSSPSSTRGGDYYHESSTKSWGRDQYAPNTQFTGTSSATAQQQQQPGHSSFAPTAGGLSASGRPPPRFNPALPPPPALPHAPILTPQSFLPSGTSAGGAPFSPSPISPLPPAHQQYFQQQQQQQSSPFTFGAGAGAGSDGGGRYSYPPPPLPPPPQHQPQSSPTSAYAPYQSPAQASPYHQQFWPGPNVNPAMTTAGSVGSSPPSLSSTQPQPQPQLQLQQWQGNRAAVAQVQAQLEAMRQGQRDSL